MKESSMDSELKNSINRIMGRLRKYFLLFLLVPVLTTVVAYFTAVMSSSSYEATAKISLGQFDNSSYNTVAKAKQLITSKEFLSDIDGLDKKTDELKDNLDILQESDTIMTVSLTDGNQSNAKRMLRQIVDAFLQKSDSEKDKWTALLQQKISQVKNLNVSSDEGKVNREKLLFELQSSLYKVKPAEIIDQPTIVPLKANPLHQAALGLLIGIMLSATLLLLPEIFRERHENKEVGGIMTSIE
ncbi:Wzz/FepE/Etk N-terminal domain-containing protein [Fictibacillus sp. Mic-4]|uniref:Wzz/FepE/Etk N-terminal domain-containing protein n=1 Tax=Fictibacillus sp. Mic-4 TaxID=3132826 RepID=UPI003CF4EC82